jgi:signal transduction histidine kinase
MLIVLAPRDPPEAIWRSPDAASARQVLRIAVDDDGRGLSPSEREQVAKRGQRIDESKPGSGLGLSIVVELAGLYGGGLTLGTAPLGGLRAQLLLPAG